MCPFRRRRPPSIARDPRPLLSPDSTRSTRSTRFMRPGRRAALLLLVVGLGAGACDDAAGPDDPGVEEVDLAALFAPPTAAELAAVEADWAGRAPTAADVRVEATLDRSVNGAAATLRVVSVVTDGNRHYGGVQAVEGAAAGSLPIVLVAHGGDGGTSAAELDLVSAALGALAEDVVLVAPAFRSEPFVAGGETYPSEGEASPWDRDVDDALAFLEAAAALVPAADPDRVAVLGFSRGGGVALLMGIRDPEIDQVVEFFGPTDMFSPWIEGVVEDALRGTLADLPGLTDLDEQVIQPLRRGDITLAQARLELVRRSPVLFAADLPDTQLHHGALDPIVPVEQGEALIEVMTELGRQPPGFEGYLYPTGGHDPFTLPGSLDRALEALQRVVPPAILAATN